MTEPKVKLKKDIKGDKEAKETYSDKNIKKTVYTQNKHDGHKEKVIQTRTYANGVVKNSCVGIVKKGKVSWGKGLEEAKGSK